MGFSRQEYWNGLPFPSPGDIPDPRIEPGSPALQADALTSEPYPYPTLYLIYLQVLWVLSPKESYQSLSLFICPRSQLRYTGSSSLTEDQTQASCTGNVDSTTGLQGKSWHQQLFDDCYPHTRSFHAERTWWVKAQRPRRTGLSEETTSASGW